MIDAKFWKTLSSRHVVRDRWISLRADRCVTARGVELDPYYVLESPEFVHVVAVDARDCVVMVRQYRHGARAMSLELPGGQMDAQDTSIEAAAGRELLEETGYAIDALEHVAALSPDPARFNNKVHFLFGTGARRVRAPEPDATEDIEVELVPFAQAISLALGGGLINSAHVAGLIVVAAQRRPELLAR